MKFARMAGLCLGMVAALLAASCGSKSRAAGHTESMTTPAPAPPTPDTTPIEALRTPAGLALKIDAATPPPAVSPAPSPSPAK